MFDWFVKLYQLIRGDRFEQIRDEIHDLALDTDKRMDDLTVQILELKGQLQTHVISALTSSEVIEAKINTVRSNQEFHIQFVKDSFDLLNKKLELFTK